MSILSFLVNKIIFFYLLIVNIKSRRLRQLYLSKQRAIRHFFYKQKIPPAKWRDFQIATSAAPLSFSAGKVALRRTVPRALPFR